MKEIIKQYGRMVIATLVGSVMIMLAAGIAPDLSRAFNLAGQDKLNSSYVGDSYDLSRSRELPKIMYKWDLQLACGKVVPVEDYIYAQYQDGSRGACKVYAILDSEGNDYPIDWEKGGRYFCFEKPGVYEIYVKAGESNHRSTYARIKLPVNCE